MLLHIRKQTTVCRTTSCTMGWLRLKFSCRLLQTPSYT